MIVSKLEDRNEQKIVSRQPSRLEDRRAQTPLQQYRTQRRRQQAFANYEAAYGSYEKEMGDYENALEEWQPDSIRDRERQEAQAAEQNLLSETEALKKTYSTSSQQAKGIGTFNEGIREYGRFLRQSEQNSMAVKQELSQFRTFEGANDSFGGRLFNKSPGYAGVSLKGAGTVSIPYFEGEYSEADVQNWEVKTYNSKITRYTSRGMPITETKLVGTRKLAGLNREDYFFSGALKSIAGNFQYAGNRSAIIAANQKKKIIKDLNQKKKEKFFKSDTSSFKIISPIKTSTGVRSAFQW